MKIDLDKNFVKYVGSRRKAISLVNKIAEKYNDRVYSSTIRKVGRLVLEVYGTQKNFSWRYNPEYKKVSVTYTDGRKRPDEKTPPKDTYYVIWVEGLTPERGEKVKRFTSKGIEYTLKMTEAMRVLPEDLNKVKSLLKDNNIADWVIDNPHSYIKTHYAPAGTLFRN